MLTIEFLARLCYPSATFVTGGQNQTSKQSATYLCIIAHLVSGIMSGIHGTPWLQDENKQ